MEPEPKPEVNVSEVLPTTEEFRTSLLMPGLSARFSMLREQDDPNSIIGKANDDSVLFPKRASRLDLFNNRGGLSDIAETDSIRAGSLPRPPFASTRTDSYGSDGYATDEGSVMSRARPGEGNTMFGGRQKIYRIPVGPAGSVKNVGPNEDGETVSKGGMGGKAIYENDAFPSAFRLARERERQEQQERDAAGDDNGNTRPSKEQDRSGSPPYPRYNRNRETSSSTNSGPTQSRASTAATSIASHKSVCGTHDAANGTAHGATSDRPLPKGKKLYGQGLDQHQFDPQPSPLQRINSLTRQRGGLARSLTQSRSATNLNDRFQRGGPPGHTSNGFRAASPSPSPTPPRMQDFDLGLNNDSAASSHPGSAHGTPPPVSPSMSPSLAPVHADATLVAALEPNDLGKATASGAFNKPQKQYNEQQYLQRQLQLQEGRGTPSPGPYRPFSPPAATHDPTTGRSRNNSQGSQFSRTSSMRHVWEHHREDRVLRSVPERGRTPSVRNSLKDGVEGQNRASGDHTFFGGISGSEIGSAPESESEADPNSPLPSTGNFQGQGFRQPPPPPPSQTRPNQNPAGFNFDLDTTRSPDLPEETASDSRSYRSEMTVISHPHEEPLQTQFALANQSDANPTAPGPAEHSHNLSGLVKQHLRNESGTSSIYPEDSPRPSRPDARESIFGHASALNQQDPWRQVTSHDSQWKESDRQPDQSVPPVPSGLAFAARHMLDQATAISNRDAGKAAVLLGNDKAQRVLGNEAPRPSHESNTPWQEQLKSHHTRVGSTETEREREGLAHELEARKRIVRNNLQTFAEGGSRDASPAPITGVNDTSPAKNGSSFGILKRSNGSPANAKPEKSSKAMKMLGLDPKNTQDRDVPPDMFMGREQYPDRAMPPPQKGFKARPQDARENVDGSPTKNKRTFFGPRNPQHPRGPSPHSSRSGSDGSERRPNSRKESAGKTSLSNGEGANFRPGGAFDGPDVRSDNYRSPQSREGPGYFTENPLPPSGPLPAFTNRSRSNSKSGVPPTPPADGQFEQRVAPPGTPIMINPSNRHGPSPYAYDAYSQPSNRPANSQHPTAHPTMINPQRGQPSQGSQSSLNQSNSRRNISSRNNSINKQDISEPTFISCTSTVDTVELPPGASLRNGMDEVDFASSAPPIPARDSRRKRTPKFFQTISGRSERRPSSPTISSPIRMHAFAQERDSPFDGRMRSPSDDNYGSRLTPPNGTHHLRRTSSDGGNMRARARHYPIPEMGPGSSSHTSEPFLEANGEFAIRATERHVPYQAKPDVPASAVMF